VPPNAIAYQKIDEHLIAATPRIPFIVDVRREIHRAGLLRSACQANQTECRRRKIPSI
jgi:hypothetical protein